MSVRFLKIELATALHVGVLGVFSSWAFGGGSAWAVDTISIVGSLAPLLTWLALRERYGLGQPILQPLLPLLPLLGFNALVLLGALQPSLRVALIEGGTVFVPRTDLSFWPSSARPELALHSLWLFDALVLSCFNIMMTIRHRSTLRALLLVLAANTLALAVFGSVQKFVNSTGLFFGFVTSPNNSFFASFIYHNHWGAFAVLMLGVSLGLLFDLRPWSGYRDFWHSPSLAAVVGIFFLAVTIPLSGSRSCSTLALLLLAGGLLHGFRRVSKHRREQGKSAIASTFALVLTFISALVLLYILARPSIERRLADTQGQLRHMRAEGNVGARAQLYGDTWRMALDRPWFGWGLASYGTVFTFYNTQHASDNLPQFYAYAHSDWLQLFAETGVIGTLFFLAMLVMPLLTLGGTRGISALPWYLFTGCGLILLYACIEFPFGNPAVTLAFWTCFFCAVRWAQLDQRGHAT